MAVPTSIRSLDSHVVPPRCTQGLSLCCRKRCTPSRGKRFLQTATARNSDALTVQLPPMPIAPPQQDYPLSRPASLQYIAPTPIHAYYLIPSLAKWFPPSSFYKKRFLQDATRKGRQKQDN